MAAPISSEELGNELLRVVKDSLVHTPTSGGAGQRVVSPYDFTAKTADIEFWRQDGEYGLPNLPPVVQP
jgi:hypothetical protein